MRVQLLVGPAGSGKTFACLAEVREALRLESAGFPLLFVAPKQSTFQLERQILADAEITGYTRLRILSFERLAEAVLTESRRSPARVLSEDGQVMVLRALLHRHARELRLFHAAARLPGFARETARTLRELRHHGMSPDRLRSIAAEVGNADRLSDRLVDLACLIESYQRWLAQNNVQDTGCLLELAAAALRTANRATLTVRQSAAGAAEETSRAMSLGTPSRGQAGMHWGALWLDGFAEMTPQELDLLTALIPFCERATLAFCTENVEADAQTWHSTWAAVGRTIEALRRRLTSLPGVTVEIKSLPRRANSGRFRDSPALAYLESRWESQAIPAADQPSDVADSVRIVSCPNAETEAVVAAREILRYVRDRGGRFRDTAVLVRSLDTHADVIGRVFSRFDIPFFLDRRESMSHHPLAELTRGALRLVAFEWRQEDWLGVIKTGLMPADEETVDRLENEALARGWGRDWWLGNGKRLSESCPAEFDNVRASIAHPFDRFARALGEAGEEPPGAGLAKAMRELWVDLKVADQLERWSLADMPDPHPDRRSPAQVHHAVWEQLNALLDNLELAFGDTTLSTRDWLAVLEAGLGNLTVGVIPPALDQVLVGAVDRSRNPDLALVAVLGFNASMFPAPPRQSALLSESDRVVLALHGAELFAGERSQLARERYYAYVACTRPRKRLVLTFAERDARDRQLSPSPFVALLRRVFPKSEIEHAPPASDWTASEHHRELLPMLARASIGIRSDTPDGTKPISAGLARLAETIAAAPADRYKECLSPAVAERLFGPVRLRCTVSRLEQFAACPFQFFISAGMRAQERTSFELDARQLGSFQHEVLARFHQALRSRGLRWRDLTPAQAREHIARAAEEVSQVFAGGLFLAARERLLTVRSVTRALEDFTELAVTWQRTACEFDPLAVELEFGGTGAPLPAWELDLDGSHMLALHGKIDRIDVSRESTSGDLWCLVLDYKSSRTIALDELLAHGVQLQLPAYLAAVTRLAPNRLGDTGARWVPAGMFYVPLRAGATSAANRSEAFADADSARRRAYCHRGRFRADALARLDSLHDQKEPSGQFHVSRQTQSKPQYADLIAAADFIGLVDMVETRIREFGRRIFAGEAAVDPYARGASEVACDRCGYRAICRIDPWTHSYRRLASDSTPVEEV